MSVTTVPGSAPAPRVAITLFPIIAVIFAGYLVIGLAMPVLPLHVHQGLGFGTFVVGLVAGSQFCASLVSRFAAGHLADIGGARRVVIIGLFAAAVAGLFYMLSLSLAGIPAISLAILLLGRAVLGGAESFMVAGALNWGLALAGRENTGKVMSWVGTAIYFAYASAAPAGSALFAAYGFTAIALATSIVPLLALLLVLPLQPIAPSTHTRPALAKVLGAVWWPGLGMALSSVGFGAITTFVALLFAYHGWSAAWIAVSAISLTFILGRIAFGHLPDRIGGPPVALACAVIEAAGLALIWLASGPLMVFIGSALAGLGYSLVYPGFGIEAVRRAPPENHGFAMGAYTACLDLALGIAGPLLGLIASGAGLNAVFLASALIAISGALVAGSLMRARVMKGA